MVAIDFSKVVTTARGVKAMTTTTVEQGNKNASSNVAPMMEVLHRAGSAVSATAGKPKI